MKLPYFDRHVEKLIWRRCDIHQDSIPATSWELELRDSYIFVLRDLLTQRRIPWTQSVRRICWNIVALDRLEGCFKVGNLLLLPLQNTSRNWFAQLSELAKTILWMVHFSGRRTPFLVILSLHVELVRWQLTRLNLKGACKARDSQCCQDIPLGILRLAQCHNDLFWLFPLKPIRS